MTRFQTEARPGFGGAKALTPDIREVRVRVLRRDWLIRFDANDPYWRVGALASLDPLSDTAFAIRSVPLTQIEHLTFAVWAEAELRHLLGAAP